MRFANRLPLSHLSRNDRPELTADARRVFTRAKAAVVVCTESAKQFARSTPLVRRDGTFDRSAIMTAATRAAQARMEVTGDAWGVCMAFALKGAWAAAKTSRHYRAH